MQNKHVKIAVTGGIGSGKSSVVKQIQQMGYPVISCDEVYKQLQTEDAFLEEIKGEFGQESVKNGKLNKVYLSQIVFSDKEKLAKLNNLTHPKIMARVFDFLNRYPLAFAEVPLLFEGGFETQFDKVIVVLRPLNDRINSIVRRDKCSYAEALSRIQNQFDYDKTDKTQHIIIKNGGDVTHLQKEVVLVVEKIITDYSL